MASLNVDSNPIDTSKKYLLEWIQKTTLVTKAFVLLSIFGCLICVFSFVGIYPQYLLMNSPHKTIAKFQIFRVFTSWILPSSFFGGIFQAISLYPVLYKIEQKKGSMYLLINIFALNTIAQILFVLFCSFFGLFIHVLYIQSSMGLWVIFFTILPIILAEPFQQRGVPFFLVKIPPQVYPFVLCIFFQFFGINLDVFFGAIVGHLAQHKYRYFNFSVDRLKSLEKSYPIRWLRVKTRGFIVSDINEYNGLPHFVPFTGELNKVGGSNVDNHLNRVFVEKYKPHNDDGEDEIDEESNDVVKNDISDKENMEKKVIKE